MCDYDDLLTGCLGQQGYAFLHFTSQEIADRAVEVLSGSSFMGSILHAEHENKLSKTPYCMYLKGVNDASESDIRELCNEALAAEEENTTSSSSSSSFSSSTSAVQLVLMNRQQDLGECLRCSACCEC